MADRIQWKLESEGSLLQAIDAIYACVTDVYRYGELPSRFAPALRAEKVTQWCFDTNLDTKSFGNHGLDQETIEDYFLNWAEQDTPLMAGLQSSVGRTSTPEGLLGREKYRSLPVFEGFYMPNGMVHQMGRFESIDPGWLVGVAAQRGATERPISDDDCGHLEVLMRHLRRAWRISSRLGMLSIRASAAERIVSSCRLATWLIEGSGRVVAVNRSAEALACKRNGGVVVTGHRVAFRDPVANDALHEALRRLERGGRTPIELRLCTSARQEFAWGVIIPIDNPSAGINIVRTLYLLVLAESGSVIEVRWEALCERLPISRSEAMVLAALMSGEEPARIADQRGSSLHTIRSVEKSLRFKLDCHTRAALVAKGWMAIVSIPILEQTHP